MERRDVLRTSRLIQDAYMELLFDNGNKKITVNDIINRAGVSRSTFYAHYQDIPALDESVENRIVKYIESFIVDTTLEELIANPHAKLEPLLRALFARKNVLHGLIVGGWKPLVLEKIRDAFNGAVNWERYDGNDRSVIESVNVCIKGVLLEACYYWSMSDDSIDDEILINTVCGFVSGGLAHLREKAVEYRNN